MRRSGRAPRQKDILDPERLRAALGERFGALYSDDPAIEDERVVCGCFWDGAAGSRVVYATLGAANTPARGELLLVAALPWHPFSLALTALACAKGRRAPLQIVAFKFEDSPFEAALFAPAEDGSLSIDVDGADPVWALRVVPITRAEHLLGRDDPERLLGLLRERDALVADPLRDCALEPARTRYFRRIMRPLLLDDARRRLGNARDHLNRMAAMNAPEEMIDHAERRVVHHTVILAHLEQSGLDAGPARRSDKLADLLRESITLSTRMVEDAVEPFDRLLPEHAIARIRELLLGVVYTHPQATSLIEAIAAEAAGVDLGPSTRGPLSSDKIVSRLAQALFKGYPDVRLAELVERGKRAAAEASAAFNPADEVPIECFVWYRVYSAMYKDLFSPDDPLSDAFRHGADAALLLVDVEDPDDRRSPREKLPDALKNVAMAAFLGLSSSALWPRRH